MRFPGMSAPAPTTTRRTFLAAAGAASLSTIARGQEAAGAPPVRLGLIGCGGRGTWLMGLAREAGGFEVVAGADYFPDRVADFGSKFQVPEARRFTGLQGYRRMIEAGGLDAVAIESPPFFHPRQALDAVAAGLHVYLAKPVAVDVPGCLMVAEAGRPLPAVDSLLAATAATHGLVMVTRNLRDFEGLGVPVIDPWADPDDTLSGGLRVQETGANPRARRRRAP